MCCFKNQTFKNKLAILLTEGNATMSSGRRVNPRAAPVGDDDVYVGTPEQNARSVKEQAKAKANDEPTVTATATPSLQAVVWSIAG